MHGLIKEIRYVDSHGTDKMSTVHPQSIDSRVANNIYAQSNKRHEKGLIGVTDWLGYQMDTELQNFRT